MKNALIGSLACLLFFLILGSETVLGLGVSPGRVTITFSPNYVYKGVACYYFTGAPYLRITTGGYLTDYLTFENLNENNELNMAETRCVIYKLTMPPKIDEPGTHRTSIWAVEVAENSGGGIVAVVRIEHQIDMYVPYCGDGNVDPEERCDESTLNGQPNHCNAQCSGITTSVCENGCDPETAVFNNIGEIEANADNPSHMPEFSPLTLGIAILGTGLGLAFLRKH